MPSQGDSPGIFGGKKSLAVDGAYRDVPRSLSGRILKWPTRADCKSAGFTPTVVRIHLLPPASAEPTAGGPANRQAVVCGTDGGKASWRLLAVGLAKAGLSAWE